MQCLRQDYRWVPFGIPIPPSFCTWWRSLLCHTEAIQSRCAVLRYSKLTDAQILTRLLEVCDKEKVSGYLPRIVCDNETVSGHIPVHTNEAGFQWIRFLVLLLPQVPRTDDGLEAIVFTAQGDMRQVSVGELLGGWGHGLICSPGGWGHGLICSPCAGSEQPSVHLGWLWIRQRRECV